MNKICANCCNCESTYPLDPKGTLYCGITEKYVYNSDSCEYFKEKERGDGNYKRRKIL